MAYEKHERARKADQRRFTLPFIRFNSCNSLAPFCANELSELKRMQKRVAASAFLSCVSCFSWTPFSH
jgi:hypothetical protein